MKKIKVVLDWFANTNHTGYFTAIEKGYYKSEGLDVEIHGKVHGVMEVKDADIVVAPQPSIMENMAAGEKITAVAVQAQRGDSGIVSLKEAGIERPRDLTGKRLTHWKPAWFHKVVGKAVNDDGGDYSKVELIQKDVGDIEGALGNITDAVWIYKNWEYYVMVHAGQDVNYFAFVDYGPVYDFLAPGVTAKHEFIDNEPEALRAFLGATGRGFKDAANDPDEGAAIIAKNMDGDWSKELIVNSQRYISPSYLDAEGNWGTIAPARWDVFADWSVEQELFEKRPEREYTNEFLR
jgi:ABC-type nitrate/sulfonate/bicarbonate transport system substrate-binding protein